MKKLSILFSILALIILLSGCGSPTPRIVTKDNDFQWEIVQSPITGRYYEVLSHNIGHSYGLMSMSEVTKAEYDKYILQEGNK